jgi:hypothetical protein
MHLAAGKILGGRYTYVKRLRRKLEAIDATATVIETVVGEGYRLREGDDAPVLRDAASHAGGPVRALRNDRGGVLAADANVRMRTIAIVTAIRTRSSRALHWPRRRQPRRAARWRSSLRRPFRRARGSPNKVVQGVPT